MSYYIGNKTNLGKLDIIIYMNNNPYYDNKENAFDVKRIESWIYNLFRVYFTKNYEGIINFSEEFCSGGCDVVTIRFSMNSANLEKINPLSDLEEIRKFLKGFVNDLIKFKDYVNDNKTEDYTLQISGIDYDFCSIKNRYNELEGISEDRLYRGTK